MRTDWRLIGLLYFTGLFAAAQFAKIALTLDGLEAVYSAPYAPYAVSAVSVAGILFGVTAGMIVAQFGARRVLLFSLLVASLMSLSQSFLPTFQAFIGLRLVEGFAHLGIVIAAPTLTAAVARARDVPVAMGLWGTFFGVGFALAAAVIPWFSGPSLVYIAHGVLGAVLAFVLWPLLPRGVSRGTWEGGLFERHLAIYSSPRHLGPGLGFLWHTVLFLGLLTFLPAIFGLWTAPVFPLLALVGTFGAGWLARRYAPRGILLAGYVLTIVGLLLALLVPDVLRLWVIFPVLVIIGLVPGASFANVPALNVEPADQARANGALAQLGNIGTAISVPLFASAAGHGFAGLAVVAMSVSGFGCAVVWLIHRKIDKST